MKTRAPHPLDPLTLIETQLAIEILHEQLKSIQDYRFVNIMTHEPSQHELLNFSNKAIDRLAFLCFFNSKTNKTFEAIINLNNIAVTQSPYGQPSIIIDEFKKCEQIVKADQNWRNAMKKRGLTENQI